MLVDSVDNYDGSAFSDDDDEDTTMHSRAEAPSDEEEMDLDMAMTSRLKVDTDTGERKLPPMTPTRGGGIPSLEKLRRDDTTGSAEIEATEGAEVNTRGASLERGDGDATRSGVVPATGQDDDNDTMVSTAPASSPPPKIIRSDDSDRLVITSPEKSASREEPPGKGTEEERPANIAMDVEEDDTMSQGDSSPAPEESRPSLTAEATSAMTSSWIPSPEKERRSSSIPSLEKNPSPAIPSLRLRVYVPPHADESESKKAPIPSPEKTQRQNFIPSPEKTQPQSFIPRRPSSSIPSPRPRVYVPPQPADRSERDSRYR